MRPVFRLLIFMAGVFAAGQANAVSSEEIPAKISSKKFAQVSACFYICKHLLAQYESQKRCIPGHSRPDAQSDH